jgi:hypothetical protein
VLIAHGGTEPVSGSFSGLAEGAELTLAGTPYTLTYKGGDGNDVSLKAVDAKSVVVPKQATAGNVDEPATTAAAAGRSSYWRPAGLAAVAAVVVLLGLVLVRRRIRRPSSSSRG